MSFEKIRYDNYCINKGFILLKMINNWRVFNVNNLIYMVLMMREVNIGECLEELKMGLK